MNIGDIMIFAFFCSSVTNEHVNAPALRDAVAEKVFSATNVTKWYGVMAHELKDHLAARPAKFV